MVIIGDDITEIINIIENNGGIFDSQLFLSPPAELTKRKELSSEELIEMFGCDNENAWNSKNLGTKWEFESLKKVELVDGKITFTCETAWSPPQGLAKFISGKYQCTVELTYAESGMYYSGKDIYTNGEVISIDDYPTFWTDYGMEARNSDSFIYTENKEYGIKYFQQLNFKERLAIVSYEGTCGEALDIFARDRSQKVIKAIKQHKNVLPITLTKMQKRHL